MDGNNKQDRLPFGRVFRIKELSGWLGKRLVVPPGYHGIALNDPGKARLFPPGEHRVLTAWERLRGRGAGLRAGYVSGEGFPLRLKAANLLSGDEELVDASLLCSVEIADPERFFREFVVTNQVVSEQALDLEDSLVAAALQAVVQEYAATDLARSEVSERLAAGFALQLEPLLRGRGLRLRSMDLLVFWQAEKRLVMAEKMLELEEKLADVDMQRRMAAVENRLQLEEFLHEVAPELAETASLQVALGESGEVAFRKIPSGQRFRAWVSAETENKGAGLGRKVQEFFSRFGKKPEKEEAKRRRPDRWWLKRSVWIGFVLVLAVLITLIVQGFAKDGGALDRWQVILGVWAFAVVAVLESIKALYERWEVINERDWTLEGVTYLDDSAAHDRQRVDTLVREQCSGELRQVGRLLEELRHQVYDPRQPDLALKIRTLEDKVRRYTEDVLNPDFGQPPYLKGVRLSHLAWQALLDGDEQVIVQAAALGEDAHAIVQANAEKVQVESLLERFEARLDAFRHVFANRARSLRPPEKDQQKYRMGI